MLGGKGEVKQTKNTHPGLISYLKKNGNYLKKVSVKNIHCKE